MDIEENNNKTKDVKNTSKCKVITIKVKLEAIAYSKDHSMHGAAAKIGVDTKCVRKWVQQKQELQE